MGKLDDLRRSGVPELDPRVDRIAGDESRSFELRQQLLDELRLIEDKDLENRKGAYRSLEMRKRAQEHTRQHEQGETSSD